MNEKILQGEIGWEVLVSDFQGQEKILMNSPGGSLFEGLAMYDFVKGSTIDVGVIGICASAATLPLIASANPWGTPNSRYLIHNPSNMAFGDAKNIDKTVAELKKEQARCVALYCECLNGTAEEIQAWMDEEAMWDAETALERGLIKEIKSINKENESDKPEGNDIKNLFTNFKMQIDMQNKDEDKLKGLESKLDKLLSGMKNFFSPKNLVVQDTNGVELDFFEIETEEQIAIDQPVKVSGEEKQSGDYVMADGQTFVIVDGVLTEIKPAEGEDNEEMEALKKENEDLKNQLAGVQDSLTNAEKENGEIKNSLKDSIASMESIKNEFTSFKNEFSDGKPTPNVPGANTRDEKKKPFTYKRKR